MRMVSKTTEAKSTSVMKHSDRCAIARRSEMKLSKNNERKVHSLARLEDKQRSKKQTASFKSSSSSSSRSNLNVGGRRRGYRAPSVVCYASILMLIVLSLLFESHLKLFVICSRLGSDEGPDPDTEAEAREFAKHALNFGSAATQKVSSSSGQPSQSRPMPRASSGELRREIKQRQQQEQEPRRDTYETQDQPASTYIFLSNRQDHLPEPLALLSPASSGAGERPKLIPLVAAESGYSENSSVNILCTVSSGHHETLLFDWFKDGQPIVSSSPSSGSQQESSSSLMLDAENDSMAGQIEQEKKQKQQARSTAAIQVDKHPDHSLLRISVVQASHAGRYTCSAKNQFGQDSSSVTLRVNVKLHWTREPPHEMVVSSNQELKLDCLAHGEPKPLIRWERLQQSDLAGQQKGASGAKISASGSGSGSNGLAFNYPGFGSQTKSNPSSFNSVNNGLSSVLVSSGRYLMIARARESDAGLYECIASNGNDADLRKIVHVQVRESIVSRYRQAKMRASSKMHATTSINSLQATQE